MHPAARRRAFAAPTGRAARACALWFALGLLIASLYSNRRIARGPPCPSPVTTNKPSHSKSKVILDRVVVLGERNSGTNAVEVLLKKNLPKGPNIQPGLNEIKHYFQKWPQHGDIATAKTLTLLVVRNPYDWLLAMHRMCYCCEDLDESRTSFKEFLDAKFVLTLEDPVTHEKRPTESCPVDVNIYNPAAPEFNNVLAARYQKAMHFMNISRWSAGFKLVRWEDMLDAQGQEALFRSVAEEWQLESKPEFIPLLDDARYWKPKDNFKPNDRRASSMYLNSATHLRDQQKQDLCKLINTKLDPYMENILGYQLLDCDGQG